MASHDRRETLDEACARLTSEATEQAQAAISEAMDKRYGSHDLLPDREALIERVRKTLFGNLCHYRQRCINERDDAEEVVKFIEAELANTRAAETELREALKGLVGKLTTDPVAAYALALLGGGQSGDEMAEAVSKACVALSNTGGGKSKIGKPNHE